MSVVRVIVQPGRDEALWLGVNDIPGQSRVWVQDQVFSGRKTALDPNCLAMRRPFAGDWAGSGAFIGLGVSAIFMLLGVIGLNNIIVANVGPAIAILFLVILILTVAGGGVGALIDRAIKRSHPVMNSGVEAGRDRCWEKKYVALWTRAIHAARTLDGNGVDEKFTDEKLRGVHSCLRALSSTYLPEKTRPAVLASANEQVDYLEHLAGNHLAMSAGVPAAELPSAAPPTLIEWSPDGKPLPVPEVDLEDLR